MLTKLIFRVFKNTGWSGFCHVMDQLCHFESRTNGAVRKFIGLEQKLVSYGSENLSDHKSLPVMIGFNISDLQELMLCGYWSNSQQRDFSRHPKNWVTEMFTWLGSDGKLWLWKRHFKVWRFQFCEEWTKITETALYSPSENILISRIVVMRIPFPDIDQHCPQLRNMGI